MRFLIELPHEAAKAACDNAVKVFKETGSHYLTNAFFGCADDVHSAWIIFEADDHAEARLIVPPPYRTEAKVVQLKQYAMSGVDDEMLADHDA